MTESKTTRRDMLKVSALFAGATLAPTMSLAQKSSSSNDAEAQQRFIQQLLIKHAKGSRTTSPEEIEAFAKRFTEVNGVVDYQALFANIDGEFRLTRAFVKSLRISS